MAKRPIAWVDSPIYSKERKVLTGQTLQVPGLRMYGHHNTAHAIAPLDTHYHKDCFEFTYLVHGNVRFSVDGRTYPLSGGDLFVTLPNEVHDTAGIPMSVHQLYWFQLEARDPDDFLYMAPAAAQELIDLLFHLPARVVKLEAGETTELLAKVFQAFHKNDPISRKQGAHLLSYFLYHVAECAETTRFLITPDIGRTIDYIFQHLTEALPMEELARIALLSESRFKQKFKAQMGTSPRDFVNFHKVEEAKNMLLEGHSVTDVAMELSFSSSNYFSSVFRRYTSFSPTQYARSMAGPSGLPPATEASRKARQLHTRLGPSGGCPQATVNTVFVRSMIVYCFSAGAFL